MTACNFRIAPTPRFIPVPEPYAYNPALPTCQHDVAAPTPSRLPERIQELAGQLSAASPRRRSKGSIQTVPRH
jgi:hypothetical protein